MNYYNFLFKPLKNWIRLKNPFFCTSYFVSSTVFGNCWEFFRVREQPQQDNNKEYLELSSSVIIGDNERIESLSVKFDIMIK